MEHYLARAGLRVSEKLVTFVEDMALQDTGIDAGSFWADLARLYARFTPMNRALLADRDRLQHAIDAWHVDHVGNAFDQVEYEEFLREIGYLLPEPEPFQIDPQDVDPEVALIAAPQLVVPALNARFLINAANARWGSLYNALYGTDAISPPVSGDGYDPVRGSEVVTWTRRFLDRAFPLTVGSWRNFRGGVPSLRDPSQLVGRKEDNLLLCHHGLHVELVIDRQHIVGGSDPAGIADIILEAATTTIVDLEDSVAAIDAADKVSAYANWLGVITGNLEASFEKAGCELTRRLAEDRTYVSMSGEEIILPGRSLLFVRNVGHHMTTSAVLLPDGSEAPEGILDGVITALIAMRDLNGKRRNSRAGSIYIVKPKMHGPLEVRFANEIFDAIEDMLALPRHTLKMGLMDEERRTSANLAACIAEVRRRIVFVNTGFLDRTGDEIHTSMRAGPMLPKGEMKFSAWFQAYEDRNVQIGLATGFAGKAQIGKGMWAAPDRMADMLAQKIAHPQSGASTAWVPSPTAATLHATHYHSVNVAQRQLARSHEAATPVGTLLTIPLAIGRNWKEGELQRELDNNAQGILGYVVRWIEQGVGCSKVPDITDTGLMEDRATLRIASQILANWILHKLASLEHVERALRRMALKVDSQNSSDPLYSGFGASPENCLAFQAALALVTEGVSTQAGYTEPVLSRFRARQKTRSLPGSGSSSRPSSRAAPEPARDDRRSSSSQDR